MNLLDQQQNTNKNKTKQHMYGYNSGSYNGTGYNGVFGAGGTYYNYIEPSEVSTEELFETEEIKEHIKLNKNENDDEYRE